MEEICCLEEQVEAGQYRVSDTWPESLIVLTSCSIKDIRVGDDPALIRAK